MLLQKYYPWFRDVKSAFTLFPLIIQEMSIEQKKLAVGVSFG